MDDKTAKAQALQNPETCASVVHAIVKQQYGEDAYAFDPLTVYLDIKDDFGVDCASEVTDRWSAIQVLMTTDAFFKRPEAFFGICNSLNDGEPAFDVFTPVSVEEAAWAITECSLQRELLPFSYAVRGYLRQILKADGFNEDNYPAVFREVFESNPSTRDIRIGLGALSNNDAVEAYIAEQLRDLSFQFNEINSLKYLDNMILQRSMNEFISTVRL